MCKERNVGYCIAVYIFVNSLNCKLCMLSLLKADPVYSNKNMAG